MQEYNDYMAVIYKHPALDLIFENNFKRVVASDHIESGALLGVEHVFSSDKETCCILIERNERIFDMYHPRIQSFAETKNRIKDATEKMAHNCFGHNGKIVLNLFTNNLNHSCMPTCSVHIQNDYNINDNVIIFFELYAVKDITKGTELTISYGPDTSHKRDFVCDCGLELIERIEIYREITIATKKMCKKNYYDVRKQICDYLNDPLSKKILLNQYLTTKGIYVNHGKISACTEQGNKLINDFINKSCGISDELKNVKPTLFMSILDEMLLKKIE